jgi:hypothetical protein
MQIVATLDWVKYEDAFVFSMRNQNLNNRNNLNPLENNKNNVFYLSKFSYNTSNS